VHRTAGTLRVFWACSALWQFPVSSLFSPQPPVTQTVGRLINCIGKSMTDNVTKTIVYANIATITNKFMRLLFSLALFSVLFMSWYPGMIGPHPYEYPTSGWLLLLATPFYTSLLLSFSDTSTSAILSMLILLISYSLPWGTLILCLLNFLQVFFYRKILVKINLLILALSISTTLITLLYVGLYVGIEKALSVLLFGFWIYLVLLLIIILYDVLVLATIHNKGI
jgi:hypothetical protein